MFHQKIIVLSLLSLHALARAETADDTGTLDEVRVSGKRKPVQTLPLTGGRKASDVVIDGEKFHARSATLGNALASERGVHSNPFGGGASAPVIRGQEGVRVKMLQNGSDVIDMSAISPDHAVAADTLLAKQVELVRGTPTLLYASASPAGVVNVADGRIPEKQPENGIEGEMLVRADSASKERAATAGVTLGLGRHFALRLEGLSRKSDLYKVPGVKLEETVFRLPDSNNKSHVGTVGLSYVGSKGYLGAAYSYRKDDYGVVGHNHMFDPCSAHIFDPESEKTLKNRYYLLMYPHLMDDSDLNESLHFHCGTPYDENKPHSHDNVYGHKHDHSSPGPQIALFSKRLDLRGEWRQPFAGFDKFKISAARAEYHHDELNDGKFYTDPFYPESEQKRRAETAAKRKGRPDTVFDNKGFNARLEAYHAPVAGRLKGVFGAQYQTQKSSAVRLMEDRDVEKNRFALVPNTNRQFSLFALEQLKLGNLTLEAGARWERQTVPVHYDTDALERFIKRRESKTFRAERPDLSAYRQKALSYSGTVLWDFHPGYRLSLTASHNERLPAPMELYYHGKHLATNSFEHGNKNLKTERSNNFEIGIAHHGTRLHYKISAYHNRFANYIHNENLHRSGNLFIRRYNQAAARFSGLEGEIGFHITPKHEFTLFGDYVRGRLKKLPAITGEKIYSQREDCTDEDGDPTYCVLGTDTLPRPDRHAARVPPARLGFRLESAFDKHWTANLEYTRVFAQRRTSQGMFSKTYPKVDMDDEDISDEEKAHSGRLYAVPVPEDSTRGYHLVNAGIRYKNRIGKADYTLSLDGNNLLNQKIYIHNSYLPYVPQMGRNFVFGVNVKF